MKIAVAGTGRLGLLAGACFAENGNDVVCVERDEARLRVLRRGAIPFFEPGLEEIVRRNRSEKRLLFTSQVPPAVRQAAVVFIAVGAPRSDDGGADVEPVLAVAKDIARAMNGYKVVAVKSTVPPGTAEKVREVIRRETTHPFSVVSNPEFAAQGAAVEDFMRPGRVVLGAEDPRAAQLMTELYAPFTRAGAALLVMDCASAEMSKYAASGLVAARAALMNEVAVACELFGADVDQVRRAVEADRRVGTACPLPAVGCGGSRLGDEVRGLEAFAAARGHRFRVLEAAGEVNRLQPERLVCKMQQHFGALSGKVIAAWGLAFGPGTDDVRDAPSIAVIEKLLAAGASVQAYDPEAAKAARAVLGGRVAYARKSYDALVGADALALLADWPEFRGPDFAKMRKLMRSPVVFDGQNLYRREQMKADGFIYYGIGR